MSQTLDNYSVGGSWVSLNTIFSIPVGDPFIISNKSTNWVLLAEGTQPVADSLHGVFMTGISEAHHKKSVIKGSEEIWARSVDTTLEAIINVQTLEE